MSPEGVIDDPLAVSAPTTGDGAAEPVEDVGGFRQRAAAWAAANLRPAQQRQLEITLRHKLNEEEELAEIARERELQRMLFDAGFAGVCVPRAYGGQGLTPAHQRALNEAFEGYEFPVWFQVPTLSPCMAVILEFGTEEQKQRHIPAILRGEELWMQLLSEPSGGSDVAGALTTAVRDGDQWILNGSKIWTTGAWWSDWGLCLARTNWDVPKHRGLTVFMLPLRQQGVEIHRIEMLNGNREFCQEFLTDVVVPDTDRVGDVDQGWTVGVRWMFHERMLYDSPLVTFPVGVVRSVGATSLTDLARAVGRQHDPTARELIGEARMLDVVADKLADRIGGGVRSGAVSEQAAAIPRLFKGVSTSRLQTIAFDIAGGAGAAWTEDDGAAAGRGTDFLTRQVSQIGGGTTEMARNVISERLLGMPRERALDRDVPFRDVPRGPSSRPTAGGST
ncbi:MAG TPA: acyl-CoA dehydrogenase family protein [Acidimicrobiales bacterium]|nr:acyl-CoA dehydrogenase family protein [Acidimicrobiales bacterium]